MFASGAFRGTSDHGIYGDAVHEVDWSVGMSVFLELNRSIPPKRPKFTFRPYLLCLELSVTSSLVPPKDVSP